jgi:hypothetical protein
MSMAAAALATYATRTKAMTNTLCGNFATIKRFFKGDATRRPDSGGCRCLCMTLIDPV